MDDGSPKFSSTFSRCCQIICSLRIEPVMLLFMFSYILNGSCLTNLLIDKGCRIHFNYSIDVCDNLHNDSYKKERNSVEMLANYYNLYINLLAPIGAFVVIFLAPWSDKYGRKPLLIYALIGFFINDIGIILCTIFFYSNLRFIIISNLATQLSGGFICVLTVTYSHVSEVSTDESRSLKYTFVQIAFEFGVTLGAIAGGQLYRYYGYLGVFVTTAVGHMLAILWVILFVPETRGLNVPADLKKKLRDLLKSQSFTDTLRTCLKSRDHFGRCNLWVLIFCSCAIALTYTVHTNITYLYTHHVYKWNPTMYAEMWAIFSFTEMLIVFVSSFVFIKKFKFSDPLIGIIGSISIICKNVFLAFASVIWFYYLSNIFGFLHSFSNLAIRSMISKLVMEDELGRVFSFLATCEAIVPLFGSVIIAKIFNETIEIFPGSCYLAATFFLMLPLGTFLYQFRKK